MHVRRMCILPLLEGMFYKYLLGPFGLIYGLSSVLPCCICLDDLSITESGVLNSPIIIVLLSISPFRSVIICLIYLHASMLGAHMIVELTSLSYMMTLFSHYHF